MNKIGENLNEVLEDEIKQNLERKFVRKEDKEEELQEIKKAEQQEKIKKQRLDNKALSDAIEARKELTTQIFTLITCWLTFIGFVLLLSGFHGSQMFWFKDSKVTWHLSDPVMMALLGTTTITVVGLFGTVVGHFFKKDEFKNSPN